MVTIIPQPYIGQGLLGDDERNNILGSFAGGLLQGFTVNPTPVMGQYFTPINAPGTMVQDGMQQQPMALTQAEFDQLMQERINQQNMMTDFGADDGFGNPGVDLPGPNPEYTSIDDAMAGMFGGFGTGGFKDLITSINPFMAMAKDRGLLGPDNRTTYGDDFEYSGYDEPQSERDAAFDADMQAEE